MSKLRVKRSTAIITMLLTLGGLVSLGAVAATSAQAAGTCPNQVYTGYIKTSSGGDYLDDYGGGSGTYVHTYQYTGSSSQTWCVEKSSPVGTGFFIHPLNNPTGLCLDAHQSTAGYPIWVYTCNGSDAQRWCWNGKGYITKYAATSLALIDPKRYAVVSLAQGGATKWYTNGATFSDNC